MKMNLTRYRGIVAALTLTLACPGAWAGKITIEPGEGNVAALLQRDAYTFIDAVGKVLLESTDIPASQVFRNLQARVQGATLSRLEYSYEKNGVTVTRVYHGRSGHSLQTMVATAARSTRNGTSGSGTDSSAGSSGDVDIPTDEIAQDAAEARFYPPDTETDIRAPRLPAESSALESMAENGKDLHANDAELKALRRIEVDINEGIVPRGGRITGYVSKTVCVSCTQAFEQFGRLADAEGTIYQLVEPPPGPLVEPATTEVQRSQSASAEFFNLRKTYAKKNLSRDAHIQMRENPRPLLGPVEALERELAGMPVPGCDE